MKKTTVNKAGTTVSVAVGAGYALLIPEPFGFSSEMFKVLATVCGYFGYEFGRWLSTLGYRPLVLFVVAMIAVPGLLFWYDFLRSGFPNLANNLLIFFVYPAAIFGIGTALGVLELKVEQITGA